MAAFAKFDPRAFLESEKRATLAVDVAESSERVRRPTNKPGALATLATLARPARQNGNQSTGNFPKWGDHHCPHRAGEDGKSRTAPAKSAKVAKAEPLLAWGEAQEECAAIIAYDGRAPRSWADSLARLDPRHPPHGVPPKRWVQFMDDCGCFIDDGWARCAERLGWGPFDLFGCDREPLARIDRMGLLWLLNGRKLLLLAADVAAIATSSGGNLKYRRCPHEADRVLAWELAL